MTTRCPGTRSNDHADFNGATMLKSREVLNHASCMSSQLENKTEGNSTQCVQYMTSVIYCALHNSVERERELEQTTRLTSHTIVRAF